MVTFDKGDLVIRIPNAGSFEWWLNINAALFNAYDYTVQAVVCADGEFGRDTNIEYLRYLANAMQVFEASAMFAATNAMQAAMIGKGVSHEGN